MAIAVLLRGCVQRGHTTKYSLGHEVYEGNAPPQEGMYKFSMWALPDHITPPLYACQSPYTAAEGVSPKPRLDTALLFTCRRIYEAAIKILYSHNTFCFAEKGVYTTRSEMALISFYIFCKTLPAPSRNLLRSLYLRIPIRTPRVMGPAPAFDNMYLDTIGRDVVDGSLDLGFEGLRGLKGLQILSLEFFLHQEFTAVGSSHVLALDALAGIRALELRELHVMVWEVDLIHGHMSRNEIFERTLKAKLSGVVGEEVEQLGAKSGTLS